MRGLSPKGIKKSYDIFKYYSEHADKDVKVNILVFEKIISKFCFYLKNRLLDLGIIKLPAGMGVLQIMGKNVRCFIGKDGKIKGVVNWGETRKLWEECEECKKNKQLVFYTNEHSGYKTYRIYWITKTNNLYNKSNYKFSFKKYVRGELHKKIMSGDYCYMDVIKKNKKHEKR